MKIEGIDIEIENAASDTLFGNEGYNGFVAGAKWALDKYHIDDLVAFRDAVIKGIKNRDIIVLMPEGETFEQTLKRLKMI